jgi:hypothetical protein
MSDGFKEFVDASPFPQRAALRVLVALVRRPRGLKLLGHLAPADFAAHGVIALGRYDDPIVAHRLGWDPGAVVARGRELRRTEGRP